MNIRFTAVYQKAPEGYIAFIEGQPGANAQGEIMDAAFPVDPVTEKPLRPELPPLLNTYTPEQGPGMMNTGSVKIIDRLSAIEAIKRLDEDDLLFLNRLIVERLHLISQARSTALMTSFTVGDRVGFQAPDGRELQGMVIRLNKKTISILTDDSHRWNVAPGLLRLVRSAGEHR